MPSNSSVQHYENFPVASWLCPAHLRPAVVAIYRFARSADDLADEGQTDSQTRLDKLQAYRADLLRLQGGEALLSPWADTIAALQPHIDHHQLDWGDLFDLLSAFIQDVQFTAQQRRYEDMAELLDYCKRSANPIGRLMLRLIGQRGQAWDDCAVRQSNDICTALQLINFWQDLSIDVARGRHYIPASVWRAHGLPADSTPQEVSDAQMQTVLGALVDDALMRMRRGATLALQVPGRMGWELRAVVQGGIRTAQHLKHPASLAWRRRISLKRIDHAIIAWRCLIMTSTTMRIDTAPH